jgi:hypothetical protein
MKSTHERARECIRHLPYGPWPKHISAAAETLRTIPADEDILTEADFDSFEKSSMLLHDFVLLKLHEWEPDNIDRPH